MRVKISVNFYSRKALQDSIYWASSEATITVREELGHLVLESENNDPAFEKKFLNTLNDFNLREEISKRTGDIRSLIIAKAFYPEMINIEPVGSYVDPVQMDRLDETK